MTATAGAVARYRPGIVPLLTVTLMLLILTGLGWYGFNSLTSGLCGNTEILRLTSPDGRHDAILFEHNCGATTDFTTHVSVLPAGTELDDDGGNAFAAEPGDTGARADWGGPPVDLAWQPGDTLMIRYDASAAVVFIAERAEGVTVRSGQMP